MIAGSRNNRYSLRPSWRASLALAALLALPGHAWAQQDDADELDPVARAPFSTAVVQPLPSQQSYQLNAALTRLAANPRDISALIDAGNAALTLGDNDAALGFFGRADQLSPGDPRVKSALASALVKNEDPFAAIPLFDAAERAGARDDSLAGDRGLAYDLVGDNLNAQRYYRQALATAPQNDEIVRRLALSQAIGGDRKAAEATLLTQLRRNDPAAWRTRAFMLAIVGDTEEAVKIATGTMPRDLSDAMVPYLRYMGRLTPAQQAAAANFGHFPRAAQIGRDDPRIARYAALNPRRVAPPPVALAAKGDAKATGDRTARRRERVAVRDNGTKGVIRTQPTEVVQRPAARLPTPAPAPALASTQPVRTVPPVRVAAATVPPVTFARPAEYRPAVTLAPTPAPTPATAIGPAFTSLSLKPVVTPPVVAQPSSPGTSPAVVAQVPSQAVLPTASAVASSASNLDLARRAQQSGTELAATTKVPSAVGQAVVPAAMPTPVPPAAAVSSAAPTSEPRRDLTAAFSDFHPPAEEQREAVMVDITKLPSRPKKAALADERGPIPDAPTGTRRIAAADPAVSTAVRKGIDPKTGKPIKGARDDKAAKLALPSHPSRIWVQLGVGRNKDALGFDWRKLGKAQAELFKGRKAWTTPWGQTNRLLVGPFETQAAASAFLKDARKKDGDAFVWTSPAGQAVDALGAK